MELHWLGLQPYEPTWQAMRRFTAQRGPQTPDQLWLCEHPPVFTLGQASRGEHLLAPGAIPVVATDRGGQVTFHGPGQVVAYPLLDLRRAGLHVRETVYRMEEAVIRTLAALGVTGHRVAGAPGVYVRPDAPAAHAAPTAPSPPTDPFRGLAKIAALGLKISRHCSYHGVALNVAMDLEPFSRINPCGHADLRTVDLSTIGVTSDWNVVARELARHLAALLAPR